MLQPPDCPHDRMELCRRQLLASAGGLAAGGIGGMHPGAQAAEETGADQRRELQAMDSAASRGGEIHAGSDFGIVGIFDIDWLLAPRFTRLLDNLAASPRAFRAARFFGALNSGVRENTFPTGGGGSVWPSRDKPPDFAITLMALNALVSRGIKPFLTLSFFPTAVSESPVKPPQDLSDWEHLVRSFLDAL